MTRELKVPDNVVALAPIMARFPGKTVAQREFLKIHGVRSAFCKPNRRGYSHWITPAGAEKLERILAEMTAPAPVAEPAPPPPPPATEPVAAPPAEPQRESLAAQVSSMCAALDTVVKTVASLSRDVAVLTEERADQLKRAEALTLAMGKHLSEISTNVSRVDGRVHRLLQELTGATA